MKLALPVSIVLTPLLVAGCSHSAPAAPAPPTAQAQLVHSVAAQTPESISATGTLHARETAVISAQIPAQIRQVLVQPADRVYAGQLLIRLDAAAQHAALNEASQAAAAARLQRMAAQSDASLAAETLARYRILQEQKSVSPQEFDEVEKRSEAAQLRLESCEAESREAQAAVAGARTQFGYTALRAPFSGVVTARLADPGTLAAPGIPLLRIDRDGPLQVYTTVDESLIASVQLGMKIPVTVEGADATPLSGVLAQIVPAADPSSRSFLVKLNLPPQKNLRAGMFATVQFPGASRSMILVPQSAVALRGSLDCVYALDVQGIARLRYVTLGNRHGDQVEVLSGVAAGETLVNKPGDRDLAGRRIESVGEVQP
ncbi:MAG TPA: efflux RND transporter periplasmic adaptor subunit [Acidobacteriaceae bacterium]|nr:efflux RND transporter periplasmic adaptor subunit [Acidobacteriaceae bacterium]